MGCFSSTEDDEAKKRSKKIDNDIKQDKVSYRATHRLLLLGIFIVVFNIVVVVYLGFFMDFCLFIVQSKVLGVRIIVLFCFKVLVKVVKVR